MKVCLFEKINLAVWNRFIKSLLTSLYQREGKT